ncbi:probable transcriptional regulator SLK3 [Henckelia pumila]|uniref:probable transcriptional regulator SLK3 n=1 Tax=Henckelia pumila TaxID=405737 RepID=UPI003C6E6997
MEFSGLPIPIGGSEPLSAVLLQLSSEGLKLTSVPVPKQARKASFPHNIPHCTTRTPNASSSNMHTRGGFLENGNQAPDFQSPELLQYQENTGLSPFVQGIQTRGLWKHSSFNDGGKPGYSSVPNMQGMRDQSILDQQRSTATQKDCGLIMFNSPWTATTTRLNGPAKFSGLSRNSSTAPQKLGLNQGYATEVKPLQAPTFSSVSPMTTLAQMNLVRQIERNRIDHNEKQIMIEKQDVPHEKHGSNSEYKPGSGAQRVNEFVLELRNRPKDNNIEFWKKLVADFFVTSAKKRWCLSLYRKDKQIETLFSKAVWKCDLCKEKAGCGFEISGEPLARLYKIKFDTGVSEEHFRTGAPSELRDESGHIFVRYSEAVEETEYQQVRIVRYGQLRVVFSPDLKICSWDFCARNHEEFIRRDSLSSQVHQLGAAVQNYQISAQDVSSVPLGELRQNSDMFVTSAYQMVDALKMPFISQIGMVKRFVRCLQISEVLNIMNDLMLYSRAHGIRPMECMTKFLLSGSNTSLSGGNLDQRLEQQHSPPETSLPPRFSYFTSAGTGTGLCHNGFGSAGVYTSKGLNGQKRQRNDLNSQTPVEMTSLGFSAIAASQFNFPAHAASTPLLSSHPQGSRSFHGKLREESIAKGMLLEHQMSPLLQQDHHSNLTDPIKPPSTANKIVQRVMAAQSYNGVENVNAIMPTSSRANGDKSSGGDPAASDEVVYIDIENCEVKNNEICFSAPSNEMTLSNFMDMDVFPRNADVKYLSPEFDDNLLEEFVDFDGLYEILK